MAMMAQDERHRIGIHLPLIADMNGFQRIRIIPTPDPVSDEG